MSISGVAAVANRSRSLRDVSDCANGSGLEDVSGERGIGK